MSDVAIRFEDVGKMYKIYGSRRDNLVDALGLQRFIGSSRERYREFWALRGVDFELRRGSRLGIIGRNGAGKSTLLKIVTGNLPHTEGAVTVNGAVQALLDVGSGLHPEFTGRENIHASLGFLGLNRTEIEEATEDIAEFTELGRFLDQPFKTYSLGMQARLGLGIATTVRPEILIIDEILGAGDAYFLAKSTARMQDLLTGGASVLLVSHALEQVARFCDETIWLDRGRVVMRGPSNEVIKAYEKFIRGLEERRLRAKNRKVRLATYDAFERDGYTDHVQVAMTPEARDARSEVSMVTLVRDYEPEDSVAVGDAQDGDVSQSASVALEAGGWSPPEVEEGVYFRRIGDDASVTGRVDFNLWFFYPDSRYAVDVRYRSDVSVSISVTRGAAVEAATQLGPSADWTTARIPFESPDAELETQPEVAVSRWSGSRGLVMDNVRLVAEDEEDQTVFHLGGALSVIVEIKALAAGRYPLIPAALVFRNDGVVVTRHVGEELVLDAAEGERFTARLDLGPLLLGNGAYLLSLGLYAKLDLDDAEPSEFYDYFDKSFEFRVTGSPPLHNEIVRHPGEWVVGAVEPPVALRVRRI